MFVFLIFSARSSHFCPAQVLRIDENHIEPCRFRHRQYQQGKGGGENNVVKCDHTIIITKKYSSLFQKIVPLSLIDAG